MDIFEVLKTPEQSRDLDWEFLFLKTLVQSKVKVLLQEPQNGPDSWPYLLVETSSQADEPIEKILPWLAARGIGLVVNPQKDYPDYVLSYGMIWNFVETGQFLTSSPNHVTNVEFKSGEKILAGPPAPEYLPDYVRKILREFFRDQGFFNVKILVVSQDRLHYDLAISLESLKNPNEKDQQTLAEALSWFLPPHYSLLFLSEQGFPQFIEL